MQKKIFNKKSACKDCKTNCHGTGPINEDVLRCPKVQINLSNMETQEEKDKYIAEVKATIAIIRERQKQQS